MNPNQYFESLKQQGYSDVDAVHFTQQYYPNFEGPSQGISMLASAPPGSLELGTMTSGGFGAPTGGLVAGTATAGGGAVAGGGMSMGTIAVVSVLVLGGVGTGGYFLYDYLTEPDFFGEVYWSDDGFGYMFEENSISIVIPQLDGGCWMYDDFEGEEFTLTEKDDLCFLEMEFETTATDEGNYYKICIDDDGDEECIKIYPYDEGMIMRDESNFCEIFVSDIEPPNDSMSVQNAKNWEDEFQDKRDSIKDNGPMSCQYFDDYDGSSDGGFDSFQFSGRDAASQMSNESGDNLVHIAMTQGADISWAVLKVSIVVDDGYSYHCDEAGYADSTSDCTFETDDDNYWSVSEEITIAEGAYDLCDGSTGGCSVDVTLTKIGVGSEDDRVIAVIYTYAEA